MSENLTNITVVVCTLNRADQLAPALESLTRLETADHFSFEIVVVDNGSTDHTHSAVESVSPGQATTIRYAYEGRPGVAAARNRGIAEAAGEWIAFFDDDQRADPAWLVELLAIAEEKASRCVGGSVQLLLPKGCDRQLATACRPLLGESPQLEAPCRYGRKMAPGTGNLMVHRSVFDEVGCFDEALAVRGEDSELFERIDAARIESWYSPRAIVLHVIPAERLHDDYLIKIARLGGWSPAKQDLMRRGRLGVLVLWLARVARALAVFFPRRLWSLVRGDRESALAMRCRIAATAGYSRCLLSLLGPKRFQVEGFRA